MSSVWLLFTFSSWSLTFFLLFLFLFLFFLLLWLLLWWSWLGSLDWDLLLFRPRFGHDYAFKLRDLMDVVPDADGQLRLASALDVCLGLLASSDLILGNSLGKASQKSTRAVVIDGECQVSLFVVEFELLRHWELLADLEELRVEFWFLLLCIGEGVLDGDWHRIVVVELERLHVEVGSKHSAVQGCSSGNDFNGVQGTL